MFFAFQFGNYRCRIYQYSETAFYFSLETTNVVYINTERRLSISIWKLQMSYISIQKDDFLFQVGNYRWRIYQYSETTFYFNLETTDGVYINTVKLLSISIFDFCQSIKQHGHI